MARVLPAMRSSARQGKKVHADQKVSVAAEEAKGAEPLSKRLNADPMTRPKMKRRKK